MTAHRPLFWNECKSGVHEYKRSRRELLGSKREAPPRSGVWRSGCPPHAAEEMADGAPPSGGEDGEEESLDFSALVRFLNEDDHYLGPGRQGAQTNGVLAPLASEAVTQPPSILAGQQSDDSEGDSMGTCEKFDTDSFKSDRSTSFKRSRDEMQSDLDTSGPLPAARVTGVGSHPMRDSTLPMHSAAKAKPHEHNVGATAAAAATVGPLDGMVPLSHLQDTMQSSLQNLRSATAFVLHHQYPLSPAQRTHFEARLKAMDAEMCHLSEWVQQSTHGDALGVRPKDDLCEPCDVPPLPPPSLPPRGLLDGRAVPATAGPPPPFSVATGPPPVLSVATTLALDGVGLSRVSSSSLDSPKVQDSPKISHRAKGRLTLMHACVRCRAAKAACTDERPCGRCTRLGLECVTDSGQRKRSCRACHTAKIACGTLFNEPCHRCAKYGLECVPPEPAPGSKVAARSPRLPPQPTQAADEESLELPMPTPITASAVPIPMATAIPLPPNTTAPAVAPATALPPAAAPPAAPPAAAALPPAAPLPVAPLPVAPSDAAGAASTDSRISDALLMSSLTAAPPLSNSASQVAARLFVQHKPSGLFPGPPPPTPDDFFAMTSDDFGSLPPSPPMPSILKASSSLTDCFTIKRRRLLGSLLLVAIASESSIAMAAQSIPGVVVSAIMVLLWGLFDLGGIIELLVGADGVHQLRRVSCVAWLAFVGCFPLLFIADDSRRAPADIAVRLSWCMTSLSVYAATGYGTVGLVHGMMPTSRKRLQQALAMAVILLTIRFNLLAARSGAWVYAAIMWCLAVGPLVIGAVLGDTLRHGTLRVVVGLDSPAFSTAKDSAVQQPL